MVNNLKVGVVIFLLVFLGYFVSAFSCAELGCEIQGMACVIDEIFEGDVNYKCIDACFENNQSVAEVGNCSYDYLYCNPLTKQLESNKCNECGCPDKHRCESDGKCVRVCSDGTETGECSSVHFGNICEDNSILRFNCTACGHCPSGTICGDNGKCWELHTWKTTTWGDFRKGNIVPGQTTPEDLNLFYVDYRPGITHPWSSILRNIAVWRNLYNEPAKTPISSSLYVDTENTLTFAPDLKGINDGLLFDQGPEWISNSSYNQFVGIELSFPVDINKISFIQTIPVIQAFKVQVKEGEEWKDVTPLYTLPHYPTDIIGSYEDVMNRDNKRNEIIFEKVKASGIRIAIPACSGPCRITEFEVYNTNSAIQAIEYFGGKYISKEYNTKSLNEEIYYDKIYFDSAFPSRSTPLSGLVRFKIRSAPSNNGEPGDWTGWLGPNCESDEGDYYDVSGESICSLHDGHNYIQFMFVPLKASDAMSHCPCYSYFLNEVNITYSSVINQPPAVSLVATPEKVSMNEGFRSDEVLFNASAIDFDGEVVLYKWDFGDGESAETTDSFVAHSYFSPGVYKVIVTAIDDEGEKGIAVKKVYVSYYNCLSGASIDTNDEPRIASINNIIDSDEPDKSSNEVKEELRIDILSHYANKKGINLEDIDETEEYYGAVALYLDEFMSFHVPSPQDTLTCSGDEYSAENFILPDVKLLIESGLDDNCNRCNNLFCGSGRDYELMFMALLRLLGVDANCVYENYEPGQPANCAGKQCGGDGYGGVCGFCSDGLECIEGDCVEAKDCTGPDGSAIEHGDFKVYYNLKSANCDRRCLTDMSYCCEAEARVCNNEILSGSFTKTSSCTPDEWCPLSYMCNPSNACQRCEAVWFQYKTITGSPINYLPSSCLQFYSANPGWVWNWNSYCCTYVSTSVQNYRGLCSECRGI